jgi:hypothetical protein
MDDIRFSSKELKDIVDRQIDTVADSVYGLFFSADDPTKVSFYDILNRIMLLLQAPVTFVLGKVPLDTQKINKRECINFNKHSFHQEKVEQALEDAIVANTFFKVFGTEYRLLVLLAIDHNNKGSNDPEYGFKAVWDYPDKDYGVLYYKLSKVLDENGNLYRKRFGDSFAFLLKKVLDNCKDTLPNPTNNPIDEKDRVAYKIWHTKFLKSLAIDQSGYKLKHDGVIDKAYKKSKSALLHLSESNKFSETSLPNFIFFLRDYSENKARCKREENGVLYEGYPYGLRILVCSEQQQDIENYLFSIRDNEEARKWYLDSNFNHEDSLIYKPIAEQVHKIFWNYLNEKDRVNGIDKIIEALTSSFGEKAYSMADPVFVGGITHFRNPSVHGGIHRALPLDKRGIHCKYEKLPESTQKDLLRIVITHYLFLGMTGKNVGDFVVMLCPIEVGGRIIGVSGYVTVNSYYTIGVANLDDDNEDHSKIISNYSHTWLQNYHVYIDSYTRFKRSLRAYFLQLYIKTIAETYLKSLAVYTENKEMTSSEFESYFNKRCLFLTRFFSYSPITGTLIKSEKSESYPNRESERVANFVTGYSFLLSYSPAASYFPITPGRENEDLKRFVSLREIAVDMSNEVKLFRFDESVVAKNAAEIIIGSLNVNK